MSDRDLEVRLADLQPPAPRDGLRDEVLAGVRAELDAPRLSRFDRLLARRSTWISAAAVLVALLVASVVASDAQDRRLDALAARSAAAGPSASAVVAWRSREALLVCLLTGEQCDG